MQTKSLIRRSLLLALTLTVLLALTGCGSEGDGLTDSPEADDQAATAPAGDDAPDSDAPSNDLPDEELYRAVLAVGLEFSYGLTPEDGVIEIVQNMEGYGSIRWTDDEDRAVIVVRRYVEGEPEEWIYDDEGLFSDGVTEVSPSGAQLQRWDTMAQAFVEATGHSGTLTRGYALTSPSGVGSTIYSTDGVTDDPNLHVGFDEGDLLDRVDFTVR